LDHRIIKFALRAIENASSRLGLWLKDQDHDGSRTKKSQKVYSMRLPVGARHPSSAQ